MREDGGVGGRAWGRPPLSFSSLSLSLSHSVTSSGDAARRTPVPSRLYMSSADPAQGKATMRARGAAPGQAVREAARPGTHWSKAGWSGSGGGGGGGFETWPAAA